MKVSRAIKKVLNCVNLDVYKIDNDQFNSVWKRPKKASDVFATNLPENGKDIGIIIQGAIRYVDDFTLETVRLYKKFFPSSTIVVSTWSNENSSYIEKIRKEGVEVVVNKFPEEIIGVQFINLQRETSKNGINKAIELSNCKYILKTRSDERIYSQYALNFMKNLLEVFPIRIESNCLGRIISTSLCSFRENRLYNVSDLCVFGYATDVLNYFSPPFDTRSHEEVVETDDPVQYAKNRPGELYFSTYYIESLGHKLQWSKEDSDYCFRELFIIIDSESIDLYWPKYSSLEYPWRNYVGGRLHRMTFSDWLDVWKA